jgi:hypothetical protein
MTAYVYVLTRAPTYFPPSQPRKVAPASRSSWRRAPIKVWTCALCTYYSSSLSPLASYHRIIASCGGPAVDSLLNALAGRCHPVAGDTLELGFVSSLALQNLSVEYFGQPYVRPNIQHPTSSLLPAADIERGALQRPCWIRTLGRRECARRRFRRLRRHLCASPADPP